MNNKVPDQNNYNNGGHPIHYKYKEPIFGAEVDATNWMPYENRKAWEGIARLPYWEKVFNGLAKIGKKIETSLNDKGLPF